MSGAASGATLEALLLRTSRTFAISIPRLPAPLRQQVTIAYLLFRVADTLEDAFAWDRARRLAALDDFADVLRGAADPAALVQAWQAQPPCDHAGYLELLEALPLLLTSFAGVETQARAAIARHALRTTEGMRAFVARASEAGELQLRDLADLQAYCYVVAGIVGELLTELILLHHHPGEEAGELQRRAVRFGEALQLVNILKDAAADADEGRAFLPATLDRGAVFTLARADLGEARLYVRALQRAAAAPGIIAFCALPIELAALTLDAVERDGPGARVGRADVQAIVARLDRALERGAAVC